MLKPKYKKIKAEMVKKFGSKKGEQVFSAWVNKENLNPETKSYFFTSEQFKAIDDEFVVGDFAVGTPDKYNDILSEKCLTDMVSQLKSLPITIDDNHESFKDQEVGERLRAINPIAKVEEPVMDGFKVSVKAVLNKAHQRYEEIKSSIKNGFLHSFSFAYIPIDYEYKSIGGVRHRIINSLRLLNGCFTGVPVQPDSMFGNVALKSLKDVEFDEEEIKSLIGGINMADEKTVEKEAEQKAAELKAEEKKVAELKAEEEKEEEAKAAELKALNEKVEANDKEIAELKAKLEKKGEEDGEDKGKDAGETAESRLAALEAKSEEYGKIFSKAQVKGLIDDKDGKINGAEAKSEVKGPIDYIK